MAASLAEIRKRLQEQENRSNRTRPGSGALYPFWNMPDDSTCVIRFLPDENPDNPFFWLERQVIKLPFPGIKGFDENKRVEVQVPCMETPLWGEKCPVHEEIRPWFKDPQLEDLARKYWKKRSYIFQGFVVDSAFAEENKPENPIRRFVINPQIIKIIKAALMDPEFEALPTDYENGFDFKITKTKDGQYANYTTSNWARKSRALSEEERAAIETHGLTDLSDFMPKKPGDEELNAIFEMFEASVDNQLYDPERWAKYYSPFNFDASAWRPSTPGPDPSKNESAPKAEAKPEPKTESRSEPAPEPEKAEEPAPEPEKAEAESNDNADSQDSQDSPSAGDILAMIRNRQQQNN